jgi:hypothetical protein
VRQALACAAVLAVAALTAGCGPVVPPGAVPEPSVSSVSSGSVRPAVLRPAPLSPGQAARLPLATTFTRLRGAPRDQDPFGTETGLILHPAVRQVIYVRPGGPPLAMLPVTELGSPTWVPAIQTRPGWDLVLLPSRPDRSTGWIYVAGGGLQNAYTRYQVHVQLGRRQLTVLDAGRALGSWTVAVGALATPTPAGRTFLLASLAPPQPAYSPLILPLGTHSATLDSYGGGPGTVALHGWPDASVFGRRVSHGCVRVPPAALRMLARVPLGTPVLITH